MKRRFLSLLLVLGLCLVPAASAVTFSDVAAKAWYATAVGAVTDAGLMNGTSGTTFTPEGLVTRGMAAAVLWRLSKSPAPKAVAAFPDVKDWYYYADAVAWCSENGVITGYGNGTFGGGNPLTREQLAVLLQRYSKLNGGAAGDGALDAYSDANKVSPWAKDGMAHAVGLGLITGRDDGRLDPAGSATRAQLAVILQRLMTPAMG